ncbi:competence type IV pilus minor pilin ComGG [Mesobacillus campisalis]|nr:competence type IV pilus minor pilin ComGG [Mesobacillus campisalis]
MSERRLYKESEKILAAEYYLLSSVKEAELQMREGKLLASGRFTYSKGAVDYQRRALSPAIEEITLTLKLHTTERWTGIAHYDKTQQKMVRWIEKN